MAAGTGVRAHPSRLAQEGEHLRMTASLSASPAMTAKVFYAAVPLGTFELPVRYKTISTQEEMAMDWNRIEGNWKQFKGSAKEKWGKLTDDDLNVIEGRREQLEGKLQQRYGFAKDQIHKDVDDWFRTLK
jgi:uncharacterized protein YjbJ (UPF0337 family)